MDDPVRSKFFPTEGSLQQKPHDQSLQAEDSSIKQTAGMKKLWHLLKC